jgi:pyrroline-5-carboxylate reductase
VSFAHSNPEYSLLTTAVVKREANILQAMPAEGFAMKVAIIGGYGKIGSAFAKGLTTPGTEVVATRRGGDNCAAASGASVLVLAVKPDVLPVVLAELSGKVTPETLVISVVAGKTLATIDAGLQHSRVVRAMPNLPAQIGRGITGWYAAPNVNAQSRDQVRQILSALGDEVELDREDQIDMVTALSGSGPAYVFLFIQTMIIAGVMIGLPSAIARRLAIATVAGSIAHLVGSGTHESTLIEAVMTPKGTTAAAFAKLMALGFQHALIEAVKGAYKRAKELGT